MMDSPHRFTPSRSRRRYPRLEVLGLIEGQSVALDVPLTVRELSQGGFSTESPAPFPPGSRNQFRFTTAGGSIVTLDATAVHCRLASINGDGRHTYITGFEFLSDPSSDDSISVLIDTLATVLSLD